MIKENEIEIHEKATKGIKGVKYYLNLFLEL